MKHSPVDLTSVLDVWARRHHLSPSQRTLVETALACHPDALASRMKITPGELETLEQLFHHRTRRTIKVALAEIRGIAERRSQPPQSHKDTQATEPGGPTIRSRRR